jgi:hypothetical protein
LKAKKKYNMSAAGHAKHVAVSMENFHKMKIGQQAKANIRAEVDEFKRQLLASDEVVAHPGKRVLVYSAAASLAAFRVIVQRLSAANLTKDEFRVATETLPTLQGTSLRVLRALGITGKEAEDMNVAPTIADIQAEYAEKHRREAAAEASDGNHDS